MEGQKEKSAQQKHAHMIGLTKAITSCLDDRNDVSHESDAMKVKELIQKAEENIIKLNLSHDLRSQERFLQYWPYMVKCLNLS